MDLRAMFDGLGAMFNGFGRYFWWIWGRCVCGMGMFIEGCVDVIVVVFCMCLLYQFDADDVGIS